MAEVFHVAKRHSPCETRPSGESIDGQAPGRKHKGAADLSPIFASLASVLMPQSMASLLEESKSNTHWSHRALREKSMM